MIPGRHLLLLAAIALFAATVFVVDLVTPVGIEVWVLYLPVILAPVWINNARLVIAASAFCSVLVVVGVFFSPPGKNPPWWDLLNRGMGLATLWLMTFAGITIARRSVQVAETMTNLRVAIARHQQAERALSRSEERLRLAAAGAGMGAWEVDLISGEVIWSDTHFRMLGYQPRPGGQATKEMWLERIHPDDVDRVLEAREQARRKRSLYGLEFRIRRASDNQIVWLAVFGRHVYDDAGEAIRFAGVSFDITQRKELEQEVLEVAAQEQRRIGLELHDRVGQELTGLGLMANALSQRLDDSGGVLPIARRLVEGLARVHEQVRVLSHGLVPVQVEADGLRAALEDLAARATEQSGITVGFDCPAPAEAPNHATATQVFHIAQEAVSNALRHGQPHRIDLSLRADGHGLTLRVEDDGVGIFERPESSSGMGLRIMEYRAGLIGGLLRIDPCSTGGTIVTCTVPRSDDDDQEELRRSNGHRESADRR